MLDRHTLPLFARPLSATARGFQCLGLSANTVTVIGCGIGFGAAFAIALSQFYWALILILINRFLDGVDGTMARLAGPTDRGGFLDIVCDFLFYAAIPLAFAIANPAANALAAAALLAAFVGTGASFLAFAAVAAKRGDLRPAYRNKAFYYLGGLTEGTETIIAFCVMCLWPQHFAWIAYAFTAMCGVTIVTRITFAVRAL